jgi:hypothetical protein
MRLKLSCRKREVVIEQLCGHSPGIRANKSGAPKMGHKQKLSPEKRAGRSKPIKQEYNTVDDLK